MAERAKLFFEEVIAPIEATHRAARKVEERIDQVTRRLRQRKNETSVATRRLQRAIPQRQAAEEVLKKVADQQAERLAEAQRLQKQVRRQTRELLSAQEGERREISAELRDEIAQALIAVDLSLLALKTSADMSAEEIEKVVVSGQRLVEDLQNRGSV